jgi:GH35 family endo-1,4-beta-xylanase
MRGLIGSVFVLAFIFIASATAQTAVQVLDSDTVAHVGGYKDDGDRVLPIAVDDTAVPFKTALRVTRKTAAEISYAAALIWPNTAAIKKGDLLLATLYVRNRSIDKGALNLDVSFQLKDEPYTPALSSATPVDTVAWQKYAVPFRALENYAAGTSTLQIRYSLKAQAFDVGGVEVQNFGSVAASIPASIADRFAYYYPGRNTANAAWRRAALARIEALRKGDMTVRVVDAAGRPMAGAKVQVEQTRSAFVWASTTSAQALVCKVDPEDSDRACPTEDQSGQRPLTTEDFKKMREALLQNFNAVSFDNNLKWTDWHNDQQVALDGMAWLKRNNMPFSRGHNLIWPSFVPDYLMPQDVITRTSSPSDVKRVITEHFAQELGVLRGLIPEWDVINEPFSNTDVQGRIASPGVKAIKGILPISAVAEWFQEARKQDPAALLFLNEFGILDNLNQVKQKNTLALLKDIQKCGGIVDGIGFQGHFGASGPVFDDMQKSIDDFAPLVKTMSLTEFDFETIDPKLQADVMEDVMTFIFSQAKFNLFQMWGFWDGDHWLGSAPLFTRDWQLKPSGAVWQTLTQKTWRTNAVGSTDATGHYRLKAFYGAYKISVEGRDKTCVTQQTFLAAGALEVTGVC